MKKIVILLLVTLLLTGCNVVRIDDQSLQGIIDSILESDHSLANVSFEGYKYYLPKGVSLVDKSDYNAILYDQNHYYYLYVDVVSYLHEVANNYKVNEESYYSKRLDYNGKTGYIEINLSNGKYFVEVMYHYAKIEAWVEEEDLKDAVTNMLLVLSSVSFNDQVLATLIGDNILNYTEESIDIFQPKREESEFLEYEQEYIYRAEEGELPSEDQIQMDEEIK